MNEIQQSRVYVIRDERRGGSMPDVNSKRKFQGHERCRPSILRSALDRWVADAFVIDLLQPGRACDRLRELHLAKLTREMIEVEDDIVILRAARQVLGGPGADRSPLVPRLDGRIRDLGGAADRQDTAPLPTL